MSILRTSKPYQTKEAYAYDVLRAAILNCDLQPGQRLVMDRLSTELGTSPIPIRAAMQRLEVEGLVEIKPHTGAVVSPIAPATITEIFTLLEVLEKTAVRAAVQKVTESDLAQLQEIVSEMDAALAAADAARWSRLNIELHRTVAEIAAMPLLLEFTNRVLDSWTRVSRYYFPRIGAARMPQAQAEHHQMVDLLARRDADAAAALVGRHNRRAYETYRELLNDDEKPEPASA